jgi:hypothetical protein
MNTITKLTILVTLLIAFFFVSAVPASADSFFSKAHTIQSSKVNSHIEVKPAQSCNSTDSNMPEFSYYTDDNTPTAYSDYLEDFAHWHALTVGECNVAPETL